MSNSQSVLPKTQDNSSSQPSAARADRRVVWEWNLRLLAISVVVCTVLLALMAAIYYWQSQRLAEGILVRAQTSAEAGDLEGQSRWLTRYLGLVPDDVDARIQLAIALDGSVTSAMDLDRARRALSAALAACGTDPTRADEKERIREKLIERLLQMGPIWAMEAEKQVYSLDAIPNDPRAMRWLAKALVEQRIGSKSNKQRNVSAKGEHDFWQLLAQQPTGQVLIQAWNANPDDVDLARELVDACLNYPEWFVDSNQPPDLTLIGSIAGKVVERLLPMENGQAQWITYVYYSDSDRELARSKLDAAVEGAISRLATHHAEFARVQESKAESDKKGKNPLGGLVPAVPDLPSNRYQPYWDWQIAHESAKMLANDNPDAARALYSRLLEFDSDAIPNQQREKTYASYGALLTRLDGLPATLEYWDAAVIKFPESLELTSLLANAYASNRDTKHSLQYLEEYQHIIQSQSERLNGPVGAQLTMAAKQAMRQRLELAEWDSFLLHARILMAEKDFHAASQEAQKAFTSLLILTNEQRVQAGRLLADCYLQLKLWDMAGQTLDRCITLAPDDVQLKRSASAAWQSAGNSERTTSQQLASLDDGSFSSALEISRSTAFAEAIKPAGLADPIAVTNALQEARRRYEAAPDKSTVLTELWQLELMEMDYATADDSSSNSAELLVLKKIGQLREIADRYPGVSEVQVIAATRLSQAGQFEEAGKAIARLATLASNTSASIDQANLALARANLDVAQKEIASGIVIIREAMQQLPDQELRLANAAKDIALRSKKPTLALEVMRSVKEEKLDINSLMVLASISISVHESAPQLVPNLEQDLTRWADRLKTIEGESVGTHWRYVDAQRSLLLARLQPEKENEHLNDASKRFNEIDARRPRWGLAAALGGQIAAARAGGFYTEEAIALLQRAIRDGDRQLGTVWLLVKQLQKAGRLEEAEIELQRVGLATASFLPLSAMMIDLAQGRGDFDKAVAVARSLVESKPQEYASWLLLSRTLLTSTKRTRIGEDVKQKRLEETAAALEKAHELSQGSDLDVWNTRFEFYLLKNDQMSAEQVVAELLKSKFPIEQKLVAAGKGYSLLKDFSTARKCLEDCLAINPKSSLAYLALADMHNRMGDSQASLEALRKAHEAEPNNARLRERYVFSLAFERSSNSTNIDQAMIDELLSTINSSSPDRSQLLKAMVDLYKGGDQKKEEALRSLREIAASPTVEGAEALRLLANYYSRLWLANATNSAANDSSNLAVVLTSQVTQRNLNEAINFYERLSNLSPVYGLDIAHYADFLLTAATIEAKAKESLNETHLQSAERLIDKLESISGSSIASLNFRIRLASARGEKDIRSMVQNWIQGAGVLDAGEQGRIWELAGRALSDSGSTEESLFWLEKAYQQDPSNYAVYVIALSRSMQVDRAFEMSVTGYRNIPSAEAGMLIAEVALQHTHALLSKDVEDSLLDAVARFGTNAELLEMVATVRLMQERYAEAASGFEAAEKLAPNRVRTLNNYAIALSMLPMGKQLALVKIEKAIDLHGRFPELLDTYGVVLQRNAKLDEAKKVLTEAAGRLNDPRFQLHLAQVAYDQQDDQAAESAWKKIDKAKLDVATLNSEERVIFARLEKQFAQR